MPKGAIVELVLRIDKKPMNMQLKVLIEVFRLQLFLFSYSGHDNLITYSMNPTDPIFGSLQINLNDGYYLMTITARIILMIL